MKYDEYRNPFHTLEVNLEIAIGGIIFRDKVIDNLRSQIKALRGMLERFIDDPEDIDEVQYAHIRKVSYGTKEMTNREQVITLAKQCGMNASPAPGGKAALGRSVPLPWLEAFFHAAQALEREACAKVCEAKVMTLQPFKAFTGNDVAHAIRQNNKHLAAAIRNRSAS